MSLSKDQQDVIRSLKLPGSMAIFGPAGTPTVCTCLQKPVFNNRFCCIGTGKSFLRNYIVDLIPTIVLVGEQPTVPVVALFDHTRGVLLT